MDEAPDYLSHEDKQIVTQFNNDVLRSENSTVRQVSTLKVKQPAANDGSLLGLFKCQYFNIHMLMRYLKDHESPGVIEYLVANKLYHETCQDLDLYLP